MTDQTIRLGGNKEENIYYGFAEGDKIVYSFEVVGDKDMKEVEIIEYPNISRFSDYKTKKIDNKTLSVYKTGVYIFRIKNSALSSRVCKIKIQRIPASELTHCYNTSVNWITTIDTTWNTYTKKNCIGYDTTYVLKTKKELVKIDTTFTPLLEKTFRVHSGTAIGKNQYTYATVELPVNAYFPNRYNPYKSTEVVCWSYWLGVGQKAAEEYEKANKNLAASMTAFGNFTGYGALASLAVTGISLFGSTNIGDNVEYKFYGFRNGQKVVYDFGNVVTASGRNEKVTQGSFFVELFNDNFREGIDVNLKIILLQVTKTWDDVQYMEQNVTPITEEQIFMDPVITTKKIPTVGQ